MHAYMILDGQWGSSGKGLLAGKLAIDRNPDVVVCNFGPNAGHTFVYPDGRAVMTQQLPTGLVNPDTKLLLGPGAIINPSLLLEEIERFEAEHHVENRLFIHPRAAVVTQYDKEQEAQGLVSIASTRKGTGSALARKVSRLDCGGLPRIAAECKQLKKYVIAAAHYDNILDFSRLIQIESAQGLELSLNRGNSYPTCTSRDIVPEQILADVAVPRRYLENVYCVIRTFPIRVGNEYDAAGTEIGHSGPIYDDMEEITWEKLSGRLGIAVLERTTVTKKIRRIFTFSHLQFKKMLRDFGPCEIFLNYVNYLDPNGHDKENLDFMADQFVENIRRTAKGYGSRLKWIGFGPKYTDVVEL